MKAILCLSYGLPKTLVLADAPTPKPEPGSVVINVRACGVNFPDVLIIQNKYQMKPPLPFSPGGEVSGEIAAVGEKVKHLKVGDRVMALCGFGGFAEQVSVNSKFVIPIPPSMGFIDASCSLYTYGTSYHALKDRANLKAGETLLVLGAAGGVGLAAVELAKIMGATVIAAASSPEKLAVCKSKGADFLIDYSKEDLRIRVKEIAGDKGVDVVYDAVGGKMAEAALRSMAWKGRYLLVGFAAGDIPQFPANLPLLKGCSIVGVFWGAFTKNEPERNRENNWELMAMYAAGKIKPHIHATYPLERAADALNEVLSKRVSGKVVLVTKT